MNKEINLFMFEKDECELIEILMEHGAVKQERSATQWLFNFEETFIQLLRCERVSQVLTLGRFAIVTNNASSGKREAESAFRKLEKTVKQTFENDLTGENINIQDSITRVKDIWVGPNLIEHQLGHHPLTLKQSLRGFVVFNLWQFIRQTNKGET